MTKNQRKGLATMIFCFGMAILWAIVRRTDFALLNIVVALVAVLHFVYGKDSEE